MSTPDNGYGQQPDKDPAESTPAYYPSPAPQPGYGAGVPYGPPYGYYPYPAHPPPRPTNGMAVVSMVLGIMWLYWVGSILSLIFGYIARKQIRERGENGDGMAIAGIVLGWIGVAGLVAVVVLLAVVGISATEQTSDPRPVS